MLVEEDEGFGFGGDTSWSPPPPFAKENLLFEYDEGVGLGGGVFSTVGSALVESESEDRGVISCLVWPGSQLSFPSLLEKDSANDSGKR